MAVVNFTIDINLDGVSYPASRDNVGGRQVQVAYVPKVKSARMDPIGNATLDPIEYTSFHRGSGASRNIGIDNMIAWCENLWTGDPGLLLPGPEITGVTLSGATSGQSARPDGIDEADGHIFIAAGQYIWKLANGQAVSPAPSQDLDLTAGVQGLSLRRFGSSLFASVTAPGSLIERPDGGAWTATALGSTAVQPTGALGRVWWATGGVTTERLVGQFGKRGIRYCAASPRLDTSWTPGFTGAAIDVGGNGQITRFATTLTHLYIGATTGLLDLDSTGMAPNLVPEAELVTMPSGGLAAMAADGYLYFSAGYQLYRVDASGTSYAKPEVITPMSGLPNETPVAGYGTAIIKWGRWLIYNMYDPVSDTSWVCFGREISQQEYYRMFTQTAQEITPQQFGAIAWNVAPIVLHGWKVTALHVSGLAADGPRLWLVGQTLAGAVTLKWAPLAYTTPYADLQAGRSRGFSQSGFAVLPAEDGGDDAIQKDVEEILNESENLGSGNSITISARKENETAFSQLGKFNSGPREIQHVGDAFLTSRPTFRIDMTGTPLSPPVSRRISVRWLPNPDIREIRKYLLKVGRAEQYASGSWSGYGADESRDNLRRLATSATRATLVDETNTALNVRVLSIDGPSEYESEESNERVLVIGVTVSIFGVKPGPSFGYDGAIGYDSGHSWS